MKRWLLLIAIVLGALALVVIPVFLIQPFRPQTQGALAWSYELRAWSPLLTVAALLAGIALVAWMWGGSHWWSKIALVVVLVPLLAATWFARQNHFEWMFNPLAGASYAQVDAALFVADDDTVMAVVNRDEAVAYPIRQMAYHHLVSDTVGGTPLVSTY